jgi:cell wall-associated NlpC family hydrolase
VKKKEMPSPRWLFISILTSTILLLPLQVFSKTVSFDKTPAQSLNKHNSGIATIQDSNEISYNIKNGDTLISILSKYGVSTADALYAAKKSDKKLLKKIRPGGELGLIINKNRTAIVRIVYTSPSTGGKQVYSGRSLKINSSKISNNKKPQCEDKETSQSSIDFLTLDYDYLPGMNPEVVYTNKEHVENPSIFNAPPDVKARIKNETKAENKRLQLTEMQREKEKVNSKKKTCTSRKTELKNPSKSKDTVLVSLYEDRDSETEDISNTDNTLESIIINDNGSDNTREKLVSIADKYLGIPYKRGQASTSGTDCSGLTLQVFRDMGLNLPRSSREQFHVGTPKSKDQLEKGDLVFFSTNSSYKKIKVKSKKNPKKSIVKYVNSPKRITHVGIYVGDGKFIHAPRTGHSVSIESLDSKYYKNRYVGARSVIKTD